MTKNPLLRGLAASHPGEFLKEIVLPDYGKSKVKVAEELGVARRTLYKVLDGEAGVSPDMALRLAKLFGNTAQFWLGMQANFDLDQARARIAEDLEAIPTWSGAAAAA